MYPFDSNMALGVSPHQFRLNPTAVWALAFAVSAILVAPQSSWACPCNNKPALKKAFDEAALVMVGRVLDQRSSPLKPGFVEVKVTALQRFKDQEGFVQETITFYTPESPSECGYSFQPGYEYLIFLSGNPAFLKSTNCSRTEVLENAQADVHRLAKIKEQPLDATDPPPATPDPKTAAKGKGSAGISGTGISGTGKSGPKELPPPRDALEEALRRKNLLSPDAVRRKSHL